MFARLKGCYSNRAVAHIWRTDMDHINGFIRQQLMVILIVFRIFCSEGFRGFLRTFNLDIAKSNQFTFVALTC
ncbi:hypothetical protein SDC9_143445 [bioreactor metagenome]|uniref:Uncharacterized protein n=1 Tax=bioreactor metagenome TaxID=1076179 RepID=A0A645E3K5_9ZZZZ